MAQPAASATRPVIGIRPAERASGRNVPARTVAYGLCNGVADGRRKRAARVRI